MAASKSMRIATNPMSWRTGRYGKLVEITFARLLIGQSGISEEFIKIYQGQSN
jgi:hypothetical protein